MAIVQIALEIPEVILEGIEAGELVMHGGVVRNLGGRLVKLLDGATLPDELKNAKELNYKHLAIGLGLVATVAIAGLVVVAIKSSKSKKEKEVVVPKCVEDYNLSLCVYLEAIRCGDLSLDKINRLTQDLDEISKCGADGKITIEFSSEQFETLISLIADFTNKLAEANAVDIDDFPEQTPLNSEDAFCSLRQYLEVQKRIFEKAA
ncbi:hypothetical protein FACS189425_02660 [Clostridia bacterium]|nr:hypothetical protein FACS189425_02660 [Clostridia bacterium]